MQFTIVFISLLGSVAAKTHLGKHGYTNRAIDICKKAGETGRERLAKACDYHMTTAETWNCKVCMNACLRYRITGNQSICNRCVDKGCGDDVITCGGKIQPGCGDTGLLSSVPRRPGESIPGQPDETNPARPSGRWGSKEF